MPGRYRVPAKLSRVEFEVDKSRFVATIDFVSSVADAKQLISNVQAEMPNANHHVYAYRVGHGNSVTEGMSDDGEPTGTAGPPALAVLRGSEIGDVVAVVSRYFGGKKLGKGGLVRAYGDAVRAGLASLTTVEKVAMQSLHAADIPYGKYELVVSLISDYEGVVTDEAFGVDVDMQVTIPEDLVTAFQHVVTDRTHGQITFKLTTL